MRLSRYIINEAYSDEAIDKIAAVLNKECKPYLNMLRGGSYLLFRGTNASRYTAGPVLGFTKMKSHIDKERKPKDMPQWLHDYMNKKMREIAGWNVRNGVSTTPQIWQAQDYGRAGLFFPVGNFDFVYLRDVYDLYAKMNQTLRGVAADILIDLKDQARERGEIKSREEVEELIKGWWQKSKKATPEERAEFDLVTSFHTPETKKWDERQSAVLKKWQESWMERDELWQAIDDLIEKSISVNSDWAKSGPWHPAIDAPKGHWGEIMVKCKEYWLLNIESGASDVLDHINAMKKIFAKLGIPTRSYKDSMPGNPAHWK